ncbi:MAG: SEC-C domain-containing protein, partial [Magnetococcales bacterium]|nr:SEC-C domain-containing protein [Magnetococcales bacterium]
RAEGHDPEELLITMFGILPRAIETLTTFGAEMLAARPDMATPKMPMRSQKIGRNAPCPCGSGKKFKKCCLN